MTKFHSSNEYDHHRHAGQHRLRPDEGVRVMFDPECYTLARYFLSDEGPSPTRIHDLAQHIQEAIEDWLTGNQLPMTCALCGVERDRERPDGCRDPACPTVAV